MSYLEKRAKFNRAFDGFWLWVAGIIRRWVMATGELAQFGGEAIRLLFVPPSRRGELVSQMEFKLVNATSLVGPTVGLGITRELGPVLTGLIVAARAGGAMAARLGTMRVTEQIDALEVMGVNPIQYLVSPRVLGSVIVMPLLTGVFDFVAMVGCWLIVVHLLDMDEAAFFDRTSLWLEPYHIYEGLFKAAIFGLFFSIICTHRGYTTKGGAAGVGSSTNRGVVLSMVMIIVLDFFLTNLITLFYRWKESFFG
jgi:phospholipid/cholesterol/gamma-HCH transport system permease protein